MEHPGAGEPPTKISQVVPDIGAGWRVARADAATTRSARSERAADRAEEESERIDRATSPGQRTAVDAEATRPRHGRAHAADGKALQDSGAWTRFAGFEPVGPASDAVIAAAPAGIETAPGLRASRSPSSGRRPNAIASGRLRR